MEKISKNKQKEVNKLLANKERNKQQLFLVFDLASIKKAKQLNLLKEAYETKDGVVGIVKFLPHQPLGNQIIYLDEISDPSNLGKIIYLMKKYGIKDLMLSPNCVSIYNEKCLAIAKENIFDINLSYGDINTLRKLKEDYQIVATGLKSTNYLDKLKLKKKFILIFGNESRGVNPDILKLAHEVVKIDIKNIDSLNVAVAASIIFAHLI
ncbi:MAG: RNA methyltransferase [Bacilli bacterium]|nr:RNA methyltransferase [Bacilli bacterium]